MIVCLCVFKNPAVKLNFIKAAMRIMSYLVFENTITSMDDFPVQISILTFAICAYS